VSQKLVGGGPTPEKINEASIHLKKGERSPREVPGAKKRVGAEPKKAETDLPVLVKIIPGTGEEPRKPNRTGAIAADHRAKQSKKKSCPPKGDRKPGEGPSNRKKDLHVGLEGILRGINSYGGKRERS